jgi:hypothetical protein
MPRGRRRPGSTAAGSRGRTAPARSPAGRTALPRRIGGHGGSRPPRRRCTIPRPGDHIPPPGPTVRARRTPSRRRREPATESVAPQAIEA